MSELVVIVNRIYRFIVMKEAFEAGLITADTWKEIIVQLMKPMIKAYKEEADDE